MHYSVCDYISDLTHNSIEADTSMIVLDYLENDKEIKVTITDNGKGMSDDKLKKAIDPFYSDQEKKKHKRTIGLGLPFITQAIEQAKGKIEISSSEGNGTRLWFSFNKNELDTPPIGDKANAYATLITYPGDCNIIINENINGKKASLEKKEIFEALGGMANTVEAIKLINQFVSENIIK